jgi:hypothetical protein
MSETEKEFKLTRFNRYLASHSWLEWLDFIDKMREDHYIFLWPGKQFTSAQEEAYKYKKLKDLLKIKKGWLIADHNHIIDEMLRRDFLLFNMAKDYPVNQVYATPFVPDYSELEKTKRYIGVHGAEYKSLPHINVTPWSWDTINTDRLYHLLGYPTPSGVIFHELCDLYALYNGIMTPGRASCDTVSKVYTNHNGVTPTGDYGEFYNNYDVNFGNWQTITWDGNYKDIRATRTDNVQLKINYKPEFEAPYRLILIGFTRNSFEFDGLGVADFANKWNVFFDSGPVQGEYHSPLIGTDQFYICKNPEAFKNITNQHTSAGWMVEDCRLFVLPPEGHFSYDYVPEEEREEWASYMVKRLHKKFPKCYPAITQQENQ